MRAQRFEGSQQRPVCFLEDGGEARHAATEDTDIDFHGTNVCEHAHSNRFSVESLLHYVHGE